MRSPAKNSSAAPGSEPPAAPLSLDHVPPAPRRPSARAWEFAVQSQRFEGSLSSMEAGDLSEFAGVPELVVLYRREDPRINTAYIE